MTSELAEEWTLEMFTGTIHRGGVGLWSWDPHARTATFDAAALRFWGDLRDRRQSLDALFERIDARDRDEAERAWLSSATSPGPYQYDFRVPQNGSHRWISARGVGGEDGLLGGKVLAVFVDVTAQREAQESLEMLVREMGHRIGNLFGVASAVTGLIARDAADAGELAQDLRARFDEMRQAFTYAVRRSGRGLEPAPIGAVVERLVSPYSQGGERVHVSLPGEAMVSGSAITDVALIMHELATNAVKYGALSAPQGHVEIEGALDDDAIRVTWREHGVTRHGDGPTRTGFGSRLMEHTARVSLGGDVERAIEGDTRVVRMRFDRERLERH